MFFNLNDNFILSNERNRCEYWSDCTGPWVTCENNRCVCIGGAVDLGNGECVMNQYGNYNWGERCGTTLQCRGSLTCRSNRCVCPGTMSYSFRLGRCTSSTIAF